jgi:Kef-type K+ transport system membrane component KefB
MMDPFLQFLLALAIIVPVAKGSGYLSNRLGQPAVLGELLIGLLLGPTLLDMLHWPVFSDTHLGETLSHLAHLGGLSRGEALRLGVGMTSRGEVGLIVATVGLGAGLVGENIFSSVVLMVLVTTLLTPILLRAPYPQPTDRTKPVESTQA